jgi:Tfp pilus assembly protein PilN
VSQVNLLPPEILQRQKRQRLTYMVAGGGAVAIVLILGFYVMQAGTLSGVHDDISGQQRSNAAVQTQIGQLQQFATLQTEAQQKDRLLDSAFADEASFSSMLQDVSRVIPSDAYLTTLTIQVTPPQPGAATATSFVGTIAAAGQAASVQTLSSWLTRLESVRGWENPWLTSITKANGVYTFAGGADLSKDVLTSRGRKAAP